ncbi:MAG: hypothetical protein NZ730_06500 [Porticoccaceae bacterium]|nr:hypothetical protein [Porticoccaceae bacterium]
MPLLSDRGYKRTIGNLTPHDYDEPDDPTFSETMRSAYGFVRDEERSVSSMFNNQSYFDRREEVKRLGDEGFNLKPYTGRYGEFNYDKFASDTGLVKNDLEIAKERNAMLAERRARSQDVMDRGSGFATFLGMAGSYMADPLNLATLPFGGVGTAAKGMSILGRTLVGARNMAAITVATETAIQPLVYKHKHDIDSPYGIDDAIRVIGITGLTAGILGGGAQGLSGYLSKTAQKVSDHLEYFPSAPYAYKPAIIEGKAVGMPTARNIETVKARIVTDEKARLLGEAGERISRGERKQINTELKSLQAELGRVEGADVLYTSTGKPLKPKSVRHISYKREAKARKKAETISIQARIDRLNKRLETDRTAAQAGAQVSRMEQGIFPPKIQQQLDDWIEQASTPETRSVFVLERMGENLRLQKGFRAEELALQAFEGFAVGTVKSIEETRDIAVKALKKALADTSAEDTVKAQDISSVIARLEADDDIEAVFKSMVKSNIEKDMKLLRENESVREAINGRTTPSSDYIEPPKTPAPKATTTSLHGNVLDEEGLTKAYNEEIATFNAIDKEKRFAQEIDADGQVTFVPADDIIKAIDDDLEGLESVMRCSRG